MAKAKRATAKFTKALKSSASRKTPKAKKRTIALMDSNKALKKLGLKYFGDEDEPECALIFALCELGKKPGLVDRTQLDRDLSLDQEIPDDFFRLHRSGISTRRLFVERIEGARFGDEVQWGLIWSSHLRVGLLAVSFYDDMLDSALCGFSFDGRLALTEASLAPLVKIIQENLRHGSTTDGLVDWTNYVPKIFPSRIFTEQFLATNDGDPISFVYTEYRPIEEIDMVF